MPTVDIAKELERLREKLLDLTLRNTLLNYRKSKSRTLELIDENPDDVFGRLVTDRKSVGFLPTLDEEDHEESSGAEGQGSLFSKGPLKKRQTQSPSYVQTKVGPDKLDRLLKGIQRSAKTAIEETGINYLHLAIGFLSWRQPNAVSTEHYAPLILVPIVVERKFDSRASTYSYEVRWNEEDVQHNHCLVHLLDKLDYGIKLPAYNDNDDANSESPDQYFRRIEKAIRGKANWAVNRNLLLGFFSFHKLMMYADLDPENWKASGALTPDSIVGKLIGGNADTGSQPLYATEYDIDSDETASRLRLLLDADSSQHSALVDVNKGKNLVIEGPPGTGKSQTITNAIAAAMHEGKTVLFVAEKVAALSVVHANLKRLGLGDFCLELHSDSASSRSVVESLKNRLALSCTSPQQILKVEEKLKLAKAEVAAYLSATSKLVGPRSQPLYELFWEVVELRSKGIRALHGAEVDLTVGETEFEQCAVQLEVLVTSLKELPNPRLSPWWGFRAKRLRSEAVNTVADRIENLLKIQSELDVINRKLQVLGRQSFKYWRQLAFGYSGTLSELAENLNKVDLAAARVSFADETRACALAFVNHLAKVRSNRAQIQSRLLVTFAEAVETIRAANPHLDESLVHCIAGLDRRGLRAHQAWLKTSALHLQEISNACRILETLGLGPVRNLTELRDALFSLQLLQHPAASDRTLLTQQLFLESAVGKVRIAFKQSQQLINQENVLEQKFHLPSTPNDGDLNRLACSLRPHIRSFLRFFSMAYWRSANELKQFWRPGLGRTVEEWVAGLEALIDLREKRQQFAEASEAREILGSLFQGVGTDWDKVKQLLNWVATASKRGFDHALVMRISEQMELRGDSMTVRHIQRLSSEFSSQFSDEGLLQPLGLTPAEAQTETFERLLERIQHLTPALEHANKIVAIFKVAETEQFGEIHKLGQLILNTIEEEADLSNPDKWARALPSLYDGLQTDIEKVECTAFWAGSLATFVSNSQVFESILHGDVESALQAADEQIVKLSASTSLWANSREKLKEFGRLDDEWLSLENEADPLNQLGQRLRGLLDNLEQLPALATLNTNLESCEEAMLRSFTEALLNGTVSESELADTYRLTVLEMIADRELEDLASLRVFSRTRIEAIREEFKKLDRQSLELNRLKIAFDIDRNKIQTLPGVSTGRVAGYTELGLIRNETRKQQRFCRIRDLFRRAPVSIRLLKPCFMMSPLSVAQFLSPGSMHFDLVIMDEASQIKPEDAIGALLRSKQMVVVGDPKQLPPTSFFDRQADGATDEEAMAIDNTESILEAAMKCFQPARRLRWHYRSKHESLIQFSNVRFYDENLIIFPSPTLQGGAFGVSFEYVPDAYFENGGNVREAEAVAKAVVEYVLRNPSDTIGVGAFNLEQSQIIADCIERECEKSSTVREAIERLNEGGEGVFVKNLENLQGDERDVIFISYTYGRDRQSGRVFNRFGPITNEHGWRRLNVLITRARKRVRVFSSFQPSEIKPGPDASRGVNAFRDYLEFAQSGIMPERMVTNRSPESPFERSVARVVNGLGLNAVPQVGVAGYFIDIGVQARDNSGDFILGIECDGATYHSSRSARDRDRLREEVIRSRGWELHRIWSTDWFQNQQHEEQRLMTAIKNAITNTSK